MSENPNREQPVQASPEAETPADTALQPADTALQPADTALQPADTALQPAGAAPEETEGDIASVDAAASEDAEVTAPEEETPPDEPKIFGMPVVIFHCMALGFAGGLILSGVLQLTRNYLLIMICVGIGWFIGKQLHKRRNQNK